MRNEVRDFAAGQVARATAQAVRVDHRIVERRGEAAELAREEGQLLGIRELPALRDRGARIDRGALLEAFVFAIVAVIRAAGNETHRLTGDNEVLDRLVEPAYRE